MEGSSNATCKVVVAGPVSRVHTLGHSTGAGLAAHAEAYIAAAHTPLQIWAQAGFSH